MRKSIKNLILSLLFFLGGGMLSGFFNKGALNSWYGCLQKSSLTPPSITFSIVWTILYIMMAISFWLLWEAKDRRKRGAYCFFGGQLFCNFLWTWLFFGKKWFFLALLDVGLLFFFLFFLLFALWRVTKLGALLLVPYFFWVLFAIYLNGYIWMYN